jgi:hypothetical protein
MDVSRARDESSCPIGFVGDLDDRWVVGIADALATGRRVHRADCVGVLPDRPFGQMTFPRAVVIHRNTLAPIDAERLCQWRSPANEPAPVLILCVGPYVRYEELERSSGVVDLVVSEAVAAEVLPGRLARRLDQYDRRRTRSDRPVCRIEVACGEVELSRALADAGVRAGYAVKTVDEREVGAGPNLHQPDPRRSGGERVLTIWEAPVLESGWGRRLEWRARQTGPVIALAGFADRAVVTEARAAGAVACLELPCDFEDLIDVVDRIVDVTPRDRWPIPARAEPPHRLPPPRRNPQRQRNLTDTSRWPDRETPPTIPLRGK